MSSPPVCEICGLRTDRLAYFLPHCTCNHPKGNHNAQYPSNFNPNLAAGKARFKDLNLRASNSLHLSQYLLSNNARFRYNQKKQLLINPYSTIYLPRFFNLKRKLKLKENKLISKQFKEAHIKIKHYSAENSIEESNVSHRLNEFKIYYHC